MKIREKDTDLLFIIETIVITFAKTSSLMILTIAIPTFNRPEKTRKTLLKIIPQLTNEVCVIILDNCSKTEIKNYLSETITGFNELNQITVYQNKVNIGPDANFARCFEYSVTQYTWTLGDDDDIDSSVVSKILFDIRYYRDFDLVGFNFNSNCNIVKREKPIIVNSMKSLLTDMDFFGNWLFLSTSVYKTQEYLNNIRFLYTSAYSMSSHISPALISVSNGKTFIFSEKYIVTNVPVDDVDDKWSNIRITLTLPSLLELPLKMSGNDYKLFGQQMNRMYVAFPHVLYSILKSVNMNINLIDEFHVYLFKQVRNRTFVFRHNKTSECFFYHSTLAILKSKLMLKLLVQTDFIKRKISRDDVAKLNLFAR